VFSLKNMPAGQYIPGTSIIHRLDARMKIISLIFLLVAIISTSTIFGYVFVLAVIVAVIKLSRLPILTVLSPIRKLWMFFIVIFIMNALFYSVQQPVFSWWIISLSEEGVRQGARVVLNVCFIMILGNILTSSTAPIDMTNALSNLLKPLKLLRVPVDDVAMIINVAIQFIPTLIGEADIIRKAQTARGARFESRKLHEKALSFLPLLIPIFISAFRRVDELSIAMEARGYRNANNRTKKISQPFRISDFTAVALSTIFCLAQIYLIG